jgi:PKD repeat protein
MECGQASGVGYSFTYEINRLRDLPADVIENQYPTHFVFNWSNQGAGSACAFFDSWNIVREVGTPNVVDYGGTMNYGGTSRWMSGYDKYYNAMKNRMWEFFSISLKDEEGLTTLKNWIDNHLNGSATGGVGNIYCSVPSASQQLPAGTPEAGKYVATSLSNYANHALCVVGYHDSICWDYNNDGQYTNDEDINNDGIVDFRDWEIGGVKLANSYYPFSWGNNGFAYLTYNALCRSLVQGGVWNQCVSVMQAKENTDPQLTFKITLTHNSRNKIKVMAGVSSELNATEPAFVMDFPILNYQGGDLYMQGGGSVSDKTLEFGLDVTALLAHIEVGQPATFFLMVDEDDSGNSATGSVNSWSVMDYTGDLIETPCSLTNVPLVENGLTTLSVGTSVAFTLPQVTTEELPMAIIDEPYENQMYGAEGTEPYRWYLMQHYNSDNSTAVFPLITDQTLTPTSTTAGYASQQIDFDFPFYDKTYNKIFIHTDGYLMFEANEFPWTFVVDEFNVFRNLRCISPYMSKPLGTSGGGGMWYEGDAEKATFRWKAIEYSSNNELNFAVTIYPSGKIEFFYGDVTASVWNKWYAGISEGNSFNYELHDISNTYNIQPNTKTTFDPDYSFTEMQLTRDGLFYGTPTVPYEELNIDFAIKDANGMRNTKSLVFSTGVNDIVIRNVTVTAGDDNIIGYGENVSISLELENTTEEVINAQNILIFSQDQYITINDNNEPLTTFQPGEVKTLTNAFIFDVFTTVPNDHNLVFTTQITSDLENYNSHIYLTAFAPELVLAGYQIEDGNNGVLEAGETATMTITVANNGDADAYEVVSLLTSTDPYVTVSTTGPQPLGDLIPGATATADYTISATENTPFGYSAQLILNLSADLGIEQTTVIEINFVDYCDASTSTQDEYIQKVVFSEINNSSGWQGGVSNFTDITATLAPGVPMPMTIINGTPWASDYVKVWIDWNMNREFGGAGETYSLNNIGGTGATFEGDITAPANQAAGEYRMRIRMTYSTQPEPCGSATYGEIEDYTVIITGINANFTAEITTLCEDGQVQFTDNSTGGPTSWSWTFEGGTPETSTEQNPLITYNTAGIYDVTLVAGDASGSSSVTKNEYVTVNPKPVAATAITGSNQGCQGYTEIYSTEPINFATAYVWTIDPAVAGSVIQDENTISVAWSDLYAGTATLKVCGVNACGEGVWSEDFMVMVQNCTGIEEGNKNASIHIYPNPTTGNFTVEFNASDVINLKLINTLGEVVYHLNKAEIDGLFTKNISASGISEGIYYLKIEGNILNLTKKIVIKK